VILTVPNSKYTHGPPLRRHSEQLHLVATVGVDGSVRRTAPQWHEPSCMDVSEAILGEPVDGDGTLHAVQLALDRSQHLEAA